MKALAYGLAAVAVATTALSTLRVRAWWVRMFDFPRLQIAILGLVAIFFWVEFVGFEQKVSLAAFAALVGAVAYQAAAMLPFTPLWRQQVQGAREVDGKRTIRLLLANVLMTNRNAAGLLRLIEQHKPDIVLAVEADQWWLRELQVLTRDYRHTLLCPQENTYGMLLFSRLKLVEPEVRFQIEQDIPSFHTRCILGSGDKVELHFLHPRPPFPTESEESTPRDAELVVVGREVKDSTLPRIVAGDLNDVAWSRTTRLFQKVSGLLDPRVGRGFYNTFHAQVPLLRFSLDHVFHSSDFRLREMRVLPSFGSDHFPVFVALSYEPDAVHEHEEPEADRQDMIEAHETVQEAAETQAKSPRDASHSP